MQGIIKVVRMDKEFVVKSSLMNKRMRVSRILEAYQIFIVLGVEQALFSKSEKLKMRVQKKR